MRSEPNNYIPISRFDYELPPELIAQTPIEPRDASRLLVVNRSSGALEDRHFLDLPSLLEPGDLLVMNDTRVLPARLFARRESGGRVELLFLSMRDDQSWNALVRSSRRLREGELLRVLDKTGEDTADIVEVVSAPVRGEAAVRAEETISLLGRHGQMPLPPYVGESLDDPERYQTVYAKHPGSAAAPTAGLHFTDRILDACKETGIGVALLTLHVGLDTFQPVKVDNALEHPMHSETYEVSQETMLALRQTRERGGRIVAVGTTVARTLESIADSVPLAKSATGSTSIYITPGYEFRMVDAMLTNFHLPRTTLLLMVSALAGEELLRGAYAHAIEERYRFYSFGDAMLIV